MAGLKDILRLYRLHTGLVTASVPGLAAFMSGGGPEAVVFVVMGSLAHHAWGFSLNEIMDLEVDRGSGHLGHKPLVSGKIGKLQAHILSVSALIFSYVCFISAVLVSDVDPIAPMVLLTIATLSGAVYDLWGKRFPLFDLFVSAWFLLLILAGAAAVEGAGPYNVAVWAAAVLGMLHILFNNSVEGGIKDAEGDRRAGTRTLAVYSGVRVSNDLILIPDVFISWGAVLRAVFAIGAGSFAYMCAERADWGHWVPVAASFWGAMLFAHSLTFLRPRLTTNRKVLIRTFALHEILSFSLALFVVLPVAGIAAAAAAFFATVLWFAALNLFLYKSSVTPGV